LKCIWGIGVGRFWWSGIPMYFLVFDLEICTLKTLKLLNSITACIELHRIEHMLSPVLELRLRSCSPGLLDSKGCQSSQPTQYRRKPRHSARPPSHVQPSGTPPASRRKLPIVTGFEVSMAHSRRARQSFRATIRHVEHPAVTRHSVNRREKH
jgi:hypothetical protein